MTNKVMQNKTQKQIAVIGGGLSGVCTAYFLALAGFEVAVLERRGNVAEEASFGNSGLLAPGAAQPLVLPGLFGMAGGGRFKTEPAILLKSALKTSCSRWVRKSRQEFLHAFAENKSRLTRVAAYGQMLTRQIQEHYVLEHENRAGVLQLFRDQADVDNNAVLQDSLQHAEVQRRAVDADAIKAIDPAFLSEVSLAGAMYYPQDESGNCVLFAKQLRAIAQSLGVQFHFAQTVTAIRPEFGGRVSIALDNETLTADAVVLAAGMQSASLLAPLNVTLPLQGVQTYSAVVPVRNPESAPQTALIDQRYKVSIARVGNRIRICGLLGFLPRTDLPHPKAINSLLKVANDYFPNAANFNSASFWSSTWALQPNGLPLLGATTHHNIFVNTGHGVGGWASAVGAAKLLADLIEGRQPDIDISGLTMADTLAATT